MYSQTELDRLIQAMRDNGVTALQVEAEDEVLHLDLQPQAAAPEHVLAPVPLPKAEAKSPGLGRFSPRGDDDGLPVLEPASVVRADEILGYVQQGFVRIPITAPIDGRVTSEAPTAGTVFGHGDVVFTLDSAS